VQAREGDVVVLRVANGLVLRAAWRAYGMPLLLGLSGAALMRFASATEGGALIGLLIGLAAGFWILRRRGLDSTANEPIWELAAKGSLRHLD
jgi:positive regulator of sigma E activity